MPLAAELRSKLADESTVASVNKSLSTTKETAGGGTAVDVFGTLGDDGYLVTGTVQVWGACAVVPSGQSH